MTPPPRKLIADWNEKGEPINLAGAALDSVEWLKLFRNFLTRKNPSPLLLEARGKIDCCIKEIEKRVSL